MVEKIGESQQVDIGIFKYSPLGFYMGLADFLGQGVVSEKTGINWSYTSITQPALDFLKPILPWIGLILGVIIIIVVVVAILWFKLKGHFIKELIL